MRFRGITLGVAGFAVWLIATFAVVEWRTSSSVACGEAISYWNIVDEHFTPRPKADSPFWDEITPAWNNMVEACMS